eukprot:s290_g37.t1
MCIPAVVVWRVAAEGRIKVEPVRKAHLAHRKAVAKPAPKMGARRGGASPRREVSAREGALYVHSREPLLGDPMVAIRVIEDVEQRVVCRALCSGRITEVKASNLQALDVRPLRASSSMVALTAFEELFFVGDPEEPTQEQSGFGVVQLGQLTAQKLSDYLVDCWPPESPVPMRGLIWVLRPYFIDWLQRRQRLRLFTQLLVSMPDSAFKRFTSQGAEAPLQALMDLTERDLLVATLVSTPVEERSRLYACVAENDLPLPLAFSGLRCPCPPEEQAEGDFITSQVDRGVTVHWEAFEALLALPCERPALLSLGAQGCSQGGKSTLLRELLGLDTATVEAEPSRPPCRSPAHNPGVDLLQSRAPLGWTVDVHGCCLGDPSWMALVSTWAASSALILLHVSLEDFSVPDEEAPKQMPSKKPMDSHARVSASRRVTASGGSVTSTSSTGPAKIAAKAELMALLKILTDAKFTEVGPQRRRILVLLRDVTSSNSISGIQAYLEATAWRGVKAKCSTVQVFVEDQKELAKFVWSTSRKIYRHINPHQNDERRKRAWEEAKGMLKELINFEQWHPIEFCEECVKSVLERQVADVLKNYLHFVLTGEIKTRHTPPKLLGETDQMLVVDKPPMFTCNYGGGGQLPPTLGCQSPTQLLNANTAVLQIHEYLALKFDYECAQATRDFWADVKKNQIKKQLCACGRCEKCATMQAGCCNRLDKETSGVMIAAKTFPGFPEIRKQFSSDHSLEVGGTEKYYFALVRGEARVKVPTEKIQRSSDWTVEPTGDGRGRIQIAMYFDKWKWKAMPWNDGDMANGEETFGNRKTYSRGEEREEGFEQGESEGRMSAITFYEPMAWFTDRSKSDSHYTLLHLQIVTGRTHQIRFHCSQIGHCLVGDCAYGAPQSDRSWAKRMCLHSYQTKFMEPFSANWYEAVSPLPKDLGDLMSGLLLHRVQENCPVFLSRRQHLPLQRIFKVYDATSQLLQSHEAPRNAATILEAAQQRHMDHGHGNGRWSEARSEQWSQKSWNDPWGPRGKDDVSSWTNGARGNGKNGDNGEVVEEEQCWGTWKPKIAPVLPEVPETPEEPKEPEPKRRRTEEPRNPQVTVIIPDTPPDPVSPATPPDLGRNISPCPWKRIESTRTPGIFYYRNMNTMETQVEPPHPWQKKQSRQDPNFWYYWNPVTKSSSVEKPIL